MAIADQPAPFKTTNVSKTCDSDVVGSATALQIDAGYTVSVPTSDKAESTRARETAPEEAVAGSRPLNDLDPDSALPLPPVTPCQPPSLPGTLPLRPSRHPSLVPGSFPLQMSYQWQSNQFLKRIPPEQNATVTKEHTPSRESVALASAEPISEPENPNFPDAKNAETPALTKSSSAARYIGVKSDRVATEPTLLIKQHPGEAGGWGFAIMKGSDANPEAPVKPMLRLDHIREVGTSSTMSASGPEALVDDALLSSLEKEDDGEASRPRFSKTQKKRMREKAEKARKHALRGEKNSLRPLSGAALNNIDNLAMQEPKPVATAPVDLPGGEGGGGV